MRDLDTQALSESIAKATLSSHPMRKAVADHALDVAALRIGKVLEAELAPLRDAVGALSARVAEFEA